MDECIAMMYTPSHPYPDPRPDAAAMFVLSDEKSDLESISSTSYARLLRRYSCAKKVRTLNLSTKKFCAKHSFVKAARKMLVKLTPCREKIEA
jgi:hypothetical protein